MQFFKVITEDRKSLGLRKNPTILYFPIRKWIKSPTVKEGPSDDGGIWVVISLSNAKRLKKYMMDHYRKKCRIFKVSIGRILFKNSYRIKTDRVKCETEIKVNQTVYKGGIGELVRNED